MKGERKGGNEKKLSGEEKKGKGTERRFKEKEYKGMLVQGKNR